MDHTGDADHWHQPLITGDHCDHTSIIIITSLSVWSDALLAVRCLCHVCLCWRILVCVWAAECLKQVICIPWFPHKAAALIPSLAQARREVFSSDAPSHLPCPLLVSLFLLANWEVRHRRLFLVKVFFWGLMSVKDGSWDSNFPCDDAPGDPTRH